MTTDGFTSRYAAYARSQGREPDAQMQHDRERWPGGLMAGFIVWIGERWVEWAERHPEAMRHHHTDEDQASFDAMLEQHYPPFALAHRLDGDDGAAY